VHIIVYVTLLNMSEGTTKNACDIIKLQFGPAV